VTDLAHLYRALRPLLFSLDAERAHELTLRLLRIAQSLSRRSGGPLSGGRGPVSLMGLEFPNRIGLAAGFDKSGRCVDALGALGFGCIEIGTVTPLAQPGNPRPRIQRVRSRHAIINRMGFPNPGIEAACRHLERRRYAGVCGLNVGKNSATPLDSAAEDYVRCLTRAFGHVDYLAINVSSPNTEGLRELQMESHLAPLLERLLRTRAALMAHSTRRLPLLLKLSPDLSAHDLEAAGRTVQALRLDGLIATNSTVQRPVPPSGAGVPGGLSGPPLRPLALASIRTLRSLLGPGVPIIGVGGIDSADAAREMFAAGADLIQIYTGLVYEGPGLVRQLARV
jgi:dihydroorotate dehydrogenase